jgi:hypothetical protein
MIIICNYSSRKPLVLRIFRAGSKIKNRALLHKVFGKPKSGARINKDTNKKPLKRKIPTTGLPNTAHITILPYYHITILPYYHITI